MYSLHNISFKKPKNTVKLTAVHRRFGEYCNSLETRSTASGGIRLWNIWRWKVCQIMHEARKPSSSKPAKPKCNYLVPRVSFYLGEFEFSVVGVHAFDLLSCWSAQDLHIEKWVKLLSINLHYINHYAQSTRQQLHRVNHDYLNDFNKLINSTFTREKGLKY